MAQIFDLFGDPVPANRGGRGRPQHMPTNENRNRVNLLLALGWNNARIAGAMRITEPTLRKHYFSELKYRDVARDRLDLVLLERSFALTAKGRIGAFMKLLERNDLMNFGQAIKPIRTTAQPSPAEDDGDQINAAPKLGKKEAAQLAAHQPDLGTPLGELMARRQGASTH